MRTDGRTDMTKLIVAFNNFSNALMKRAYSKKEINVNGKMCVCVS
jgi:hypothetical protein